MLLNAEEEILNVLVRRYFGIDGDIFNVLLEMHGKLREEHAWIIGLTKREMKESVDIRAWSVRFGIFYRRKIMEKTY